MWRFRRNVSENLVQGKIEWPRRGGGGYVYVSLKRGRVDELRKEN
jgi:hypothetical protein